MGLLRNLLISALLVTCVSSLIIPDEITSLLSLIYSNIPPIKKGTDSRLGVGFRLGPHADFQVVLELGPQSNTQPIGPSTDTKRRRNSEHPVRDTTLGQQPTGQGTNNELTNSWLAQWRSALRGDAKVTTRPRVSAKQVTVKSPALQMPSEASPDVVSHLSQLFVEKDQGTSTGNNTADLPSR